MPLTGPAGYTELHAQYEVLLDVLGTYRLNLHLVYPAVLADMDAMQFRPTPYLYAKLLSSLRGIAHAMDAVLQVWNHMVHSGARRTVRVYHAVLDVATDPACQGPQRVAFISHVLRMMMHDSVAPTARIICGTFHALGSAGESQALHTAVHALEQGRLAAYGCSLAVPALSADEWVAVYETLVRAAASAGDAPLVCEGLQRLWQLSTHPPDATLYAWSVERLCQLGRRDAAIQLVQHMRANGLCGTGAVYGPVLMCCVHDDKVSDAVQIVQWAAHDGTIIGADTWSRIRWDAAPRLLTALLDTFGHNALLDDAAVHERWLPDFVTRVLHGAFGSVCTEQALLWCTAHGMVPRPVAGASLISLLQIESASLLTARFDDNSESVCGALRIMHHLYAQAPYAATFDYLWALLSAQLMRDHTRDAVILVRLLHWYDPGRLANRISGRHLVRLRDLIAQDEGLDGATAYTTFLERAAEDAHVSDPRTNQRNDPDHAAAHDEASATPPCRDARDCLILMQTLLSEGRALAAVRVLRAARAVGLLLPSEAYVMGFQALLQLRDSASPQLADAATVTSHGGATEPAGEGREATLAYDVATWMHADGIRLPAAHCAAVIRALMRGRVWRAASLLLRDLMARAGCPSATAWNTLLAAAFVYGNPAVAGEIQRCMQQRGIAEEPALLPAATATFGTSQPAVRMIMDGASAHSRRRLLTGPAYGLRADTGNCGSDASVDALAASVCVAAQRCRSLPAGPTVLTAQLEPDRNRSASQSAPSTRLEAAQLPGLRRSIGRLYALAPTAPDTPALLDLAHHLCPLLDRVPVASLDAVLFGAQAPELRGRSAVMDTRIGALRKRVWSFVLRRLWLEADLPRALLIAEFMSKERGLIDASGAEAMLAVAAGGRRVAIAVVAYDAMLRDPAAASTISRSFADSCLVSSASFETHTALLSAAACLDLIDRLDGVKITASAELLTKLLDHCCDTRYAGMRFGPSCVRRRSAGLRMPVSMVGRESGGSGFATVPCRAVPCMGRASDDAHGGSVRTGRTFCCAVFWHSTMYRGRVLALVAVSRCVICTRRSRTWRRTWPMYRA